MISSTRLALGALLVFDGLYASAMRFEGLLKRDATTNATCGPNFAWMNNARGDTPCQLAARLIAPCHGGNWNIRDLPAPNLMYDLPEGNEAEGCTCSWAVYNLISACATCQGVPQAVRPWPDYKAQCPDNAVSETSFYPWDRTLSTDVTFPIWATNNPTNWTGSTFNLAAARDLWGTGDLPQPLDPSKGDEKPSEPSSSSAGPIAGGVVGGVVVVLAAAALAFFLLKRHRKRAGGVRGMAPSDVYSTHYRSPSDATDKSGFSMGYTNLSSTTAGSPPVRSATIRTHNTSIYPFSTFGVPDQATAPQRVGPSPPPVAYSPPPVANSPSPAHSRQTSGNREDIITPFILQQPVSDHSGDRKTPLGNVPQYDSPNAPPARAGDALFETPQRNRMNPPAYSPHDTPSPPPAAATAGPSRTHLKNGSADTHRTNPSFSGNNAIPQPHLLGSVGRTESTSDIYTSPPESVSGVPEGTTLTRTGTTATSFPRDVKRRPGDEGFNGRDLA